MNYHRCGKPNKARSVLEGCISGENRYFLALCCFDMSEYSDAERALLGGDQKMPEITSDTAIETPNSIPNGAAGLHLLGNICRRTNRLELAARCYEKALGIDSLHWSSFKALAELGVDIDGEKHFKGENSPMWRYAMDHFVKEEESLSLSLPRSSSSSSSSSLAAGRNNMESERERETETQPRINISRTPLTLAALSFQTPKPQDSPLEARVAMKLRLGTPQILTGDDEDGRFDGEGDGERWGDIHATPTPGSSHKTPASGFLHNRSTSAAAGSGLNTHKTPSTDLPPPQSRLKAPGKVRKASRAKSSNDSMASTHIRRLDTGNNTSDMTPSRDDDGDSDGSRREASARERGRFGQLFSSTETPVSVSKSASNNSLLNEFDAAAPSKGFTSRK